MSIKVFGLCDFEEWREVVTRTYGRAACAKNDTRGGMSCGSVGGNGSLQFSSVHLMFSVCRYLDQVFLSDSCNPAGFVDGGVYLRRTINAQAWVLGKACVVACE